jgi:osmotically-inducible protein OsmY
MKSATQIRGDVIDELRWDPQISDLDAIGVAVSDEAVTLTGHVPIYAGKLAATRAAERVCGVTAVANDLTAEPPASREKVQQVIEDAFRREAEVDARYVRAEVSDHTARLYGHVHSVHEAGGGRLGARERHRAKPPRHLPVAATDHR